MPGRTVSEAIDAFLDPLKEALACVGRGHITLSDKARGQVGEPCTWVLNRGESPVPIGGGYGLAALMGFEVLDRGSSQGDDRFKVSTRAYLYSILDTEGVEVVSAHWHPSGKSHVSFPHWHFGTPVLNPDGVFTKRAHIPSPRMSFESLIRTAIEVIPEVDPTCEDWRDRLGRTEELFNAYKSW